MITVSSYKETIRISLPYLIFDLTLPLTCFAKNVKGKTLDASFDSFFTGVWTKGILFIKKKKKNQPTLRIVPWLFPRKATVWSFSTATATAVSSEGVVSTGRAFRAKRGLLANGDGRKSPPHLKFTRVSFCKPGQGRDATPSVSLSSLCLLKPILPRVQNGGCCESRWHHRNV